MPPLRTAILQAARILLALLPLLLASAPAHSGDAAQEGAPYLSRSGDLPDDGGYLGLPWGATVEEAKRALPDLRPMTHLWIEEGTEVHTTNVPFRMLADRGLFLDALWFYKGRFYSVQFVQHDGGKKGHVGETFAALVNEYGRAPRTVNILNYRWTHAEHTTTLTGGGETVRLTFASIAEVERALEDRGLRPHPPGN